MASFPWFQCPEDARAEFPAFVCSDGRVATLASDFFARHFFARPGPSAYTGDNQSDWREWNALCTEWVDTGRHPALGRDYNADLAHFLENVELDDQGYVYTYPPGFPERNRIGWPFPDHRQSGGALPHWTFPEACAAWRVAAGVDEGGVGGGWRLRAQHGAIEVSIEGLDIPAEMSPYLAVDVDAGGGTLRGTCQWTSTDSGRHGALPFVQGGARTLFLPLWRRMARATRLRGLALRFDVPADRALTLLRVEPLFDTRHSTNNSHFVMAAVRHALWSGDAAFLVRNADRVRAALHFLGEHCGGERLGFLQLPWWGHDGLTGVGHGIGSNYWDLLPLGHRDLYGTAYYLGAIDAASAMEALFERHPGWRAPPTPYGHTMASLRAHAARVRRAAAEAFWHPERGRFVGSIDVHGGLHDHGYVFANLEALYYGLGGAEEARAVFGWLDGEREIGGDTSRGADIYHWRFAPRATTRRNEDWYFWGWDGRRVGWGDQVQDGGAVLYTSFHDVMARLRHQGPERAWTRLGDVLDWYEEVQRAGGYRAYYSSHEGSLQGAGTAGGLGIDAEFVESALVPLTLLYGFLGVEATAEGLRVEPRLPPGVAWLGVRHLRFGGRRYHITAGRSGVRVEDADSRQVRSASGPGRTVRIAHEWRT